MTHRLTEPGIPEWEQEIIDLFVGIFDGFGLSKSTAMIYGTLYCAEKSMLQEEIANRLQISAGSASQGLKLLQGLGAVQRQSPIGQRQSYYSAERSMRRLVGSVVDSQLRPKLRSGKERLERLAASVSPEETHALQRIQTLQTWQRKVERGMPFLSKIFGSGDGR
jgi:HTH-type transcriptional regulator, glycine betaine synthesis regulator